MSVATSEIEHRALITVLRNLVATSHSGHGAGRTAISIPLKNERHLFRVDVAEGRTNISAAQSRRCPRI
jgi:hypothetical protein